MTLTLGCTDHLEDIAQRMVNAENCFIATVCEIMGWPIGDARARTVLAVYTRLRVVRLDIHIGRYQVVHGTYLEQWVIANAVGLPDASERKDRQKAKGKTK